ncbi:hypothetical protein [Streptomyces sp. SPB4]|uniref:hypothetical protein n=1 Tax=Streptomyces sp. SPB4 TaxID=2940553 RepID=UPI0024733D92|nr:hypothetical protein [Streptomyces sp. SPB4]MDH6539318.1 ABC-type sugar transport system substrate-binding protein [Streptomyces sp. SPB4]
MKKKRALGVLAATFVAAALPMVAASPASASTADCQVFLRNVGYNVGPRVEAACTAGADRSVFMGTTAWSQCVFLLGNLGVKHSDVITACDEARN